MFVQQDWFSIYTLTYRSTFSFMNLNLHSIKILKDEIDASNISDCCPYFIANFINSMSCYITTNPYVIYK